MSTTPHRDADSETLSALFDGELREDAARFALKRLDHDPQWREACGRWQLLGDALRGQAMGVAPVGFADRVGAALADASAATATTGAAATGATQPVRRRWVGGAALAASVAVAALFVTRPFSPETVPSTPTPQVATNAPAAVSTTAATDTMAVATPAAPAEAAPSPVSGLPSVETGLAATTVAAADVSRRTGERRARAQGQRATAGAMQLRETETAASSAVVASIADTPPPATGSASPHPFLPRGEIVSRPWPRAALPDYPAGNAFNVSFDNRAGYAGVYAGDQASSPGASSFYPFEPRMLDAESLPDSATGQPPAPDERTPDARDWPQR